MIAIASVAHILITPPPKKKKKRRILHGHVDRSQLRWKKSRKPKLAIRDLQDKNLDLDKI